MNDFNHSLQVMSGYATSVLQYENDVLLSCDLAHKILRDDNVMDQIYELFVQKLPNAQKMVERKLIGAIVMTRWI